MCFELRLLAVALIISFVQVNCEDYFLDDPCYNQTCQEQHPEISGIHAEHDRKFGGCRYICTATEQRFTEKYLLVPNNIPCGRNKACMHGVCHYLTDIANCKSALNSEKAIIKLASCRLKCLQIVQHELLKHAVELPIPVFHREGLPCQTKRYGGICLDGKCVRERTRSVQPQETVTSIRTRKQAVLTEPDDEVFVKIDHYCRERYQDPRESITGREVEMTRGCQYFCEETDVWESSVAFKAPDGVSCDPQASKVCNNGHCRRKEDIEECQIAFNTSEAVVVTRVQDFPCTLKCTLPSVEGWRMSYEKRRAGIECSNVYIRNGFCNKQGICIQEPSY